MPEKASEAVTTCHFFMCILSRLLSFARIRPRCFFFSLSRLSVGELKKKKSKTEGRKKKTSGTSGNKKSCPGLSHNSALLLDSITAPNSQVFCNFLRLSVYLPPERRILSLLPIRFSIASIYLVFFVISLLTS